MAETFDLDLVPVLARGFRLRHDPVRDQWVVLGPERAFVPDPIAVEILQAIDGTRRLRDIAALLAERYAAPEAVIGADILALAQDLSAKGLLKRA